MRSFATRLTARLSRNGNQIDLRGDTIALAELAQLIHRADKTVAVPLHIPVGTSPHPYGRFAMALTITITEGNVRISEGQGQITITGSRKKLDLLAGNIEFVAGSVQGTHLHIEFYPSHFYLEEDSVPLIVSQV